MRQYGIEKSCRTSSESTIKFDFRPNSPGVSWRYTCFPFIEYEYRSRRPRSLRWIIPDVSCVNDSVCVLSDARLQTSLDRLQPRFISSDQYGNWLKSIKNKIEKRIRVSNDRENWSQIPRTWEAYLMVTNLKNCQNDLVHTRIQVVFFLCVFFYFLRYFVHNKSRKVFILHLHMIYIYIWVCSCMLFYVNVGTYWSSMRCVVVLVVLVLVV